MEALAGELFNGLRYVIRYSIAKRIRPRRSSTVGPCVRLRKAARGPAMTAPNASAAPSFTWRSTRSAICWRSM
jgi:hypothetical protein